MKKIKITTVALLCIAAVWPGSLRAQQYSQNVQQREYQRQYYQDYSRWSVGANLGISSLWGDLRSFSDGKTYIGGLYGLSLGYQLSPTIGFTLLGEYGINKLGATAHNRNFPLEGNYAYHGAVPMDYVYGDIYSRVEAWHVGLTWNINLNNLISGNDGTRNRRWTFLASPGIYMQLFEPVLKAKSGSYSVAYPLYNNWNLGVGGDLAVQWKAGKAIDLQLKGGMRWIDNAKFDGISSAVTMKNNGMGYLSAGLIWKIGKRNKTDHMLYAATRRYVNKTFDEPVRQPVEVRVERVEVPVERIVKVEVPVADLQTPLATVHFQRGKSTIDETKYAAELQNIMASLRNAPDIKIQIWGYCDHTGSDRINAEISLARAQALKDYLIAHGIASDRIAAVRGMGADPAKSGDEKFAESARRAEIVKN